MRPGRRLAAPAAPHPRLRQFGLPNLHQPPARLAHRHPAREHAFPRRRRGVILAPGAPPSPTRNRQEPARLSTTLHSPPFLAPYPAVLNHGLIPHDVLAKMKPAWRQRWFPARPITQSIHENAYVTHEGLAFTPTLDPIPASIGQYRVHHIDQARAHIRAARAIPRLPGTYILCKKSGAHHYGHWLLELLPRAFLARPNGPARILLHAVQDPLRAIMRQSLACLGIAPDLCVETGPAPIQAERLLILENLTDHGLYMSPLVLDCLQTLAARIPPAEPRKLFLTRPGHAARNLANQHHTETTAARQGYTVLDPATLPFAAQVARFKSATEIIGIAGSALANAAFAPAGISVTNLVPTTMPDTFYWFIATLRGQHYTEIRCATDRTTPPSQQQTTAHDDALILTPSDSAYMFAAHRPPPPTDPDWPHLAPDLRPLFAADFYAAQIQAQAGPPAAMLEHYDREGWRRGLDPSPMFSTTSYLRAYPDIAAAATNPLLHYIHFGRAEGRQAWPPGGRQEGLLF